MPDLYPPPPPWDGVERRKQPPASRTGGRRAMDKASVRLDLPDPGQDDARITARSSYVTVSRANVAAIASVWGLVGGVLGSLATLALTGSL